MTVAKRNVTPQVMTILTSETCPITLIAKLDQKQLFIATWDNA
jgi:hypothetical protein